MASYSDKVAWWSDWLGSAAITSVQLVSQTSNFASSADLRVYGRGIQ